MLLGEIESKQLLKEAGLNVCETRLAKTREEAVSISEEIGYPVVFKISSPDIVHKSDSGGVRLNITNKEEAAEAYDGIMGSVRKSSPDAFISGIAVQSMAPKGIETIIGVSQDEQFGHVIMFGLGGVWVEMLKDVSFRVVPVERKDSVRLIREIRGFDLLNGYRGQPPVSLSSLEDTVMSISRFIEDHPEVRELDMNPVLAYPDGALVVDARIVVDDIPGRNN